MAIVCSLLSLIPGYAELSAVAVEQFAVYVELDDSRYVLPPPIAKRMTASVSTIAENVLMGRRIQEVQQKKPEYERLIQEVLDRILFGYTVKQVQVTAGENTEISVRLVPWSDVIKTVNCSVEVDQMPPEVTEMVLRDIQGIEQVVLQLLQGLPLDAADWTQGILRDSLQSFLDVRLPEFRVHLMFEAAETSQVKIILYPKGLMVRDVALSLKSESVPNLALLAQRSALQKKADSYFLGVPIDFIARHQAEFINYICDDFMRDSWVEDLGIQVNVAMDIAQKMQLYVQADTDRYRFYIEGYLDVGKKDDNSSIRVHLGKYISRIDEIYLETDFFPNRVAWAVRPGISRKVTPKLTLGVKYDLNQSNLILWANHEINHRYTLRFERIPKERFHEVGLRYHFNELVGFEYVINSNEKWLRMVGNF